MFTPSQIALIARHVSDAVEGGGAGHTAYAPNTMRRRYVVGGVTKALIFPIGASRHAIRAGIRGMIHGLTEQAQTLGMWENEGSVYVDLGDMWHSLDIALAVAAQRGELAIYDRESGDCIPVPPAFGALAG